jgi:hypothetical protein
MQNLPYMPPKDYEEKGKTNGAIQVSGRRRIEDLGRLAVLLDQLRENPAIKHRSLSIEDWFQEILKDLAEYKEGGFGAIDEDADTKLWKLLMDISDASERIYECLDIAEGTDRLNEEHVER